LADREGSKTSLTQWLEKLAHALDNCSARESISVSPSLGRSSGRSSNHCPALQRQIRKWEIKRTLCVSLYNSNACSDWFRISGSRISFQKAKGIHRIRSEYDTNAIHLLMALNLNTERNHTT
jgi:hypothetical protein